MAVNEPHGGSLTTPHIGLGVPWVQYVGRSTPSPTSFNLSWGSNQAVMTVDINMADLLTAIPQILGTAQRILVPAGQVQTITLTSGGTGYQTAPAVLITDGSGTGAGARATATLVAGSVNSIVVNSGGYAYSSSPVVSFEGGAPVGAPLVPATANAIINNVGQVPFINRTLPMRYPYIPHMVCTKIQQGQPLIFSGITRGSNVPSVPIPDSATYQYCRLTLLFQAPGYTIMDDATLINQFAADESKRFVEGPKRVNTLFNFNRRGADFAWTETSTTGTEGPPLDQPINFGILTILTKQQIVAKWLHLPEACLFPNGPYGPSPNIDAAYGGINGAVWNNQEAGTVLFDNWKPEIEEAPYPLALNQFIVPQRLWSVEFSFRIFNPPHDPGNPTRGWNLNPWPDGLWYAASQIRNKGIGALRVVDFQSVFVPN